MSRTFVRQSVIRKLVSMCCIVLVFCMISVCVGGCVPDENAMNIVTPPEEKTDATVRASSDKEFVAKAVIKTVESARTDNQFKAIASKSTTTITDIDNADPTTTDIDNSDIVDGLGEEEENTKFSYSFDYLEITRAEKFNVILPKPIDVIEQKCGVGELEIFVGEFVAYKVDANNPQKLNDVIADKMIVFRGAKGLYSCLENGFSVLQGASGEMLDGNIAQFSSHKVFGESSVDKDFTPPIHLLYIHRLAGKISIGYEMSSTEEGWSGFPDELFEAVPDSYEVVDVAKMYDVREAV